MERDNEVPVFFNPCIPRIFQVLSKIFLRQVRPFMVLRDPCVVQLLDLLARGLDEFQSTMFLVHQVQICSFSDI